MIPRRLALRNFMCYREDVPPLDFEGLSIACLSGENGAGKSTLLDALTWSLWGEARLKSDDDLIALGATEMEVDLTFALDGLDYRVIRKRSKGKRGQTWLDFQVCDNGAWRSLSGAGVRETQESITRTLRMGYETFTNSAFLRQGHADEFTRKKPAERKAVLAEILGLSVYEELEAAAKERGRGVEGQIRGLEGKIEAYGREAGQREIRAGLVAAAEDRAAEIARAALEAEQALGEATERVRALESLKPLREERRAQLARVQGERDRLVGEIEVRQRDVADASTTIARREEIVAGVTALRAAQEEADRLDSLRADYDALVDRRRGHADTLRAAEQQLRTELRLAEGELRALQERAARRPQLVAQIAELEARLAGLAALSQELTVARSRRVELREKLREVNELQLRRKDCEGQIKLKHDSLVGTREEWKRQIKEADARLKDVARWRAERERAATERAHLERTGERLDGLRATAQGLAEQAGGLRESCSAIKSRGDEINKKLALLGQDTQVCPLCGGALGHDGVARIEAEYERQRKELRGQYAASKREADSIDEQLGVLRGEIQALERQVATLPEVAGRLARLDADLASADELRQRQAAVQRDLSALELQLLKGDYEREARAELARVEATIAALGEAAALDREAQRLDDQIDRLEKQSHEHSRLGVEIEAVRRRVAELDAEADTLRAAEGRAADLSGTLERDDYGHAERAALAALDNQIAAAGYSPELHKAARERVRQLAAWDEEERRLERAEERLARDRELLSRDEAALGRADEQLATARLQLAELEARLRELALAIAARDEAARYHKDRQRELDVTRRDLVEKQMLLQRAEDAARELEACELERAALQRRKGLFDELTVAFGKKGVQALLIETAIPEIEHEANALLSHMTDNQMHLTFETQRDTKKGDVAETLEIKIADGLGTRDYDAYSGGESFRVDFAIRIALAKLLARRAGARLETLVIDEGFGSQDARGRERLVEAITAVQRDFRQILVVTHIQELKDMFPAYIEITKTPQGSLWALG